MRRGAAWLAFMLLRRSAKSRGTTSVASVQTLAATTPLMLLVATFLVRRHALPLRIVFAGCAVVFGVALTAR